MFMGANDAYWQVRYEDGDRTIVSYKTSPDPEPDPALRTVRFRDLVPARPECSLTGVAYEDGTAGGKLDYVVAAQAAGDPWLAGTGLQPGAALAGTVGYEWDAAPACRVPHRTIVFSWSGYDETGHASSAAAVRYRAPSGACVFSTGSLQFVWALDDGGGRAPSWAPPEPAVQRFARNAIDDMTRPPTSSHASCGGPRSRSRVRSLVSRRAPSTSASSPHGSAPTMANDVGRHGGPVVARLMRQLRSPVRAA
jgi:hypothetical protein